MDGGGNGIPGGALPTSMGAGGMLGLDMSLHPHSQLHQHSGHSQLHQQLPQAHHMLPFQAPAAADGDHPVRHAAYMPPFVAATRGKQHSTMSPEEEPGYGEEVDDQARRGGTSQAAPAASPWQRMKWNDNMVRLLIQVVYRVGDDGGGPEVEQQQAHGSAAKGKKSAAAAAASALLQKKGKWKSVSRAMMEKGYSVSPQQCEDKFNDLNKRYKRVNDLLGKGTACLVVENQALLETMDISAKAKEEARKLLNSKHLFFREMCAYHHAGGGSTCTAPSSHQPPPPPPPPPDQQQQQLCFHHPSTGRPAIGGRILAEEEGMTEAVDDDDDDVDSEDDEDFEDEEDEDDDDKEDPHHKRHGHGRQHHHMHEDGEEEDSKEFAAGSKKHGKRTSSQMSASPPLSLTLSSPSSSVQQLRSEMMAIAGGGEQQQRQWLRRKAADLEEQRLGFQCRAFQLERQRFKWLRFSSNKEREMERMKLDNERHRLENDRMLLLLRQKELELVQHGGSGGGGVSSTTEQHHVPNADRPSTTT